MLNFFEPCLLFGTREYLYIFLSLLQLSHLNLALNSHFPAHSWRCNLLKYLDALNKSLIQNQCSISITLKSCSKSHQVREKADHNLYVGLCNMLEHVQVLLNFETDSDHVHTCQYVVSKLKILRRD